MFSFDRFDCRCYVDSPEEHSLVLNFHPEYLDHKSPGWRAPSCAGRGTFVDGTSSEVTTV